MAITYTVTTRHDLSAARSYVAFRNEVLWPTRKLQRALIAACAVAVGFMFVPGGIRYALWAVAGLIVLWMLLGDRLDAARHLRCDPHRGRTVTHVFNAKGICQGDADDAHEVSGGADTPGLVPYAQIIGIYADAGHWIIRMRSGELIMLARDGVDSGTTTADRFESFLTSRTRLEVETVRRSLRTKVQRAQDGRRGYLDANPSILTRTLRQRSEQPDSGE